MAVDSVVADLTAVRPAIRDGELLHEVGPTFCMPWFPGESPIFGAAAARHRRASVAESVSGESRFDLKNRGRYHWGEPWIGLARDSDSLHRANVCLPWNPPEEKRRTVEIQFVDVIRDRLNSFSGRDKRLGLVVPSALGPGPQQEIIDALSSLFGEIQLIPRTIAIALQWCRSEEGERTLMESTTEPGQRIGNLLVTTANADRWEAVLVPIRLERTRRAAYLCPVHDRVKPLPDLPIVGIAHTVASNREQVTSDARIRIQSIENPVVTQPATVHAAIEETATLVEEWSPKGAGRDDGASTPFTIGRDDYRWDLGSVHCGTQIDGRVPEPLSALHENNPAAHCWSSESILEGAQHAMDLLGQGLPPFFEALAPLQLRVQERNEYEDPVETWRPLIREAEVPAGKEYHSPAPIEGLALPAGTQAVLPLYLRTKHGKEWEFFKATAKVEDPQPRQEKVQITARMLPGRGLATVDISSVRQGLFSTYLRLDRLESIEHPPPVEYAWPPGSAYVVWSSGLWHTAKYAIQTVVQTSESGFAPQEDLRTTRELINKWQLPETYDFRRTLRHLPAGIDRRFVYRGAIPSSTSDHEPEDVKALIVEFSNALETCLKAQRPREYREAVLWTASWLYSNCPKAILEVACRELKSDPPVEATALAVAGNCFSRKPDISIFFQELAWCIQNASRSDFPPRDWLRAYRNIARLRADALETDVLDHERQSTILNWYFDVFEEILSKPRSSIFVNCVYLAPHLLKRRRFDREFLTEGTPEFLRFERLLESAAVRTNSPKHQTNAKCALEFLRRTATEATLETLAQIID